MKKWKHFVALGIIGILLSAAFKIAIVLSAEYREGHDKDYFDITDPRDVTLLSNVETYHLSEDSFWKWAAAGKYGYALDELNFVLRYFPNHPEALPLLGMIAKATKNLSLPITYYVRALSLYPQYALTHAQYGIYLVEIGLNNDGIVKLKHSVELEPKLAIAYAGLAKGYEKAGKKDQARICAEQARSLGYSGKLTDSILEAQKGKKKE
jgi:predicted Zn-dependent protease